MKGIIFSHAGGFSSYYQNLKKQLEEICPQLEIAVFDYQERHWISTRKTGYQNFSDIIETAVDWLINDILEGEEEYWLFGHSMGAYVASEVAFRMQYFYNLPPKWIGISGQSSPVRTKNDHVEDTDQELLVYLQRLGNFETDKMVKEYLPELLNIIRTDMKLLASYSYKEKCIKLESKVFVLYGEQDKEIDENELDEWKQITRLPIEKRKFAGGHFYIQENIDDLCKYINENCMNL